MSITRYWTEGTNFCCGEGEIVEGGDFIMETGARIVSGKHFGSKESAFYNFCNEIDEKIQDLKDEVEVLRDKL